jgi:hypothetical protein
MAPLPHNNTSILYVDYTVSAKPHVLPCRISTASSYANGMSAVDGLLTALGSSIKLWTIDGARAQDVGTNVSYPITWTGAGTYGSGAGTADETAVYFDFVGRSIDGRRVKVTTFGAASVASNGNYRVSAGESGPIDAALAVLLGLNDEFVTISGLPPVWQNYANQGINAYWTKQIR